jgi:hypothetical protein
VSLRLATTFVIAAQSLGGLHVGPATTYDRAMRYFGPSATSSLTADFCTLSYRKLGLRLDFADLDPSPAKPSTCTFFFGATVTARAWHTRNGLRVGEPAQSVRRLFPHALDIGVVGGAQQRVVGAGSHEWWLTHPNDTAAHPILVAYVHGGSVVALGIEIVGH